MLGSFISIASSPPPTQAFEGRLQRGSMFSQNPMDSRLRGNDDINIPASRIFAVDGKFDHYYKPSLTDTFSGSSLTPDASASSTSNLAKSSSVMPRPIKVCSVSRVIDASGI